MNKGRSKAGTVRTWMLIVCIIAGLAAAAYIGFTYWVDKYGDLTKETWDTPDGMTRRDGVFTLLVAATDEGEERTDSIMVATFDFNNQTVNVLNIPRDTLVDTERTDEAKKINASYREGVDQLCTEVQSVIGYRPDRTMILNFDGIASIVDSIGGIEYTVPFDMNYHDASQNLSIELKKGTQTLNGEQTVEFLRWRHNDDGSGYEDGDVGRVEKLQDFLKAFGSRIFRPGNLFKLPQMAKTMADNVDTDLTQAQLMWLAMQGIQMDMSDVSMETLVGDSAEADINMGYYLWYYIVDEEMALEQINRSFNPFVQPITELDIVTPDTISGAYSPNWIEEKEYRYTVAGLDFTYEPPETDEWYENDSYDGEDSGYSDDNDYDSDYGYDGYNDYDDYDSDW